MLSNNVFWVFGKRFFQTDTYQLDSDEAEAGGDQSGTKQSTENLYPIQALVNDYQLNVLVVKKHEVRMYDIGKGRLQSMHMNLFREDVISSEITKFRIDKRHRKAYVANNQGRIFVINAQNGVVLKNVT